MDEETFVAAARADCLASDPGRGRGLRPGRAVLPVLPRARALLAQAIRVDHVARSPLVAGGELCLAGRWSARLGSHWRRTDASIRVPSSSAAHGAPGRRGTTEPDGEPDRRARTGRARDRIGAGRGPRGDRRGRQLLRRDRSGGRPAELGGWLADRGLEPGWSWMTFRRDVAPLRRRGDLVAPRPGRARRSDGLRRDRCGRLRLARRRRAVGGEGLPGWLGLLARARRRRSRRPQPEYSSPKGSAISALPRPCRSIGARAAQNALLAARIRHAREAGCDVVVTETGERRDDRPSSSYRNILRAGFTEVRVDGELAAGGRRQANPVTSQRRRRKRTPISARRVTIRSAERGPDAAHPPVGAQRDTQHGGAREQRRRHRHRQVAAVARPDQDSVECEHDPVERLHQREDRPQQRALGEHARIRGEGARDHARREPAARGRRPPPPRTRARSSARSRRRQRRDGWRRALARR